MAPRRRFDPIYWILYRYIFLKFIKNEGPCCCWCFSASLVSEKILALELRVKMLVIYQIVGFFKEKYLLSKSEMKLTFCKHINFWRTCQDSQSNIRILRGTKSHEGCRGLTWCFIQTLIKAVNFFSNLAGCV